MPYTYLIGWKSHNLWYYGVRYAKNCKPEELWKSYKTSSVYVKEAYEKYGNPDIVQIRKTFKTKQQAMVWEHKVLKRIKVTSHLKWLNKTDNKAIDYHTSRRNTLPGALAGAAKTRGKTYEELYGPEKAAELKAARALSNSLRKVKHKPRTDQQRKRYSDGAKRRWANH